jgi:hypothetical protein
MSRHTVNFDLPHAPYGVWAGSQIVPLYEDGSFDFTNDGNVATAGWVFMLVRAFSIPSTSLAAVVTPVILFHQLPLPATLEFAFAAPAALLNVKVPGLPYDVRYILADVFVTLSVSDFCVLSLGRSGATSTKFVSDTAPPPRGPPPSSACSIDKRPSCTSRATQ